MNPNQAPSELRSAVLAEWPLLRKAVLFGLVTNLLVLAPTLYMMEVYDRVVNSRSMMTLAMLTLLVIFVYVVMEVLEWVRHGLLHEVGQKVDEQLGERVFDSVFDANLKGAIGLGLQPLNDLKTLRDFSGSPAVVALMDAPMAAVFIFVLFLIHPVLGATSLAAAVVQVIVAYLTERNTQPQLLAANRAASSALQFAGNTLRNAPVVEAMGMMAPLHGHWLKRQNDLLLNQAQASDSAGGYSAIAKAVQLSVGSLMLGLSCWLLIKGQFGSSGGMMIVASVLGGRILAPLVQLIGSWKLLVGARDAYARLDKHLSTFPARQPGMPLPPPKGQLNVETLTAGAPGSMVPIVKAINFSLPAGATLGVVGPSASGKSTLARLMVGIWPALSGKVRLDGVDIHPWNKAELGPHIGYLPQDVELFEGTLADNIARFGPVDVNKVEAAARAVGLHELILALPEGYATNIGDEGAILSGGQRQRVGLARAIYGHPRLVVLDEPNSSLDEAGERLLVGVLLTLKQGGATVVVVTHRMNVLSALDNLVVLQDGAVRAIGPRDEVLKSLAAKPAAVAGPATPVVPASAAQPA